MPKTDPNEEGLAAGEAAASAAGGADKSPAKGDRMYVRTQNFGSSDSDVDMPADLAARMGSARRLMPLYLAAAERHDLMCSP